MRKSIFSVAICLAVTLIGLNVVSYVNAETLEEREAKLRAQLEQIEKEQAVVEANLNIQKAESASIERDVSVLTNQIRQAELNIQKRNLIISELGEDISLKDQTVAQLNARLADGKESMAELLRQLHSNDDISLVEVVLSEQDLSDFFVDLDSYNQVKDALGQLFQEIREIKGETEQEKVLLTQKQNQERDIQAEIAAEKRTVEVKESEKKSLLAVSKQEEYAYEKTLQAKREQAAAIRSALFQLRDTQGISFGDAVKYAKAASKATGVRPAFILGILKQETNLGQNVGTCNRAGDPPEKKWYNIMPGPNDGHRSYRDDQTVYLRIVKGLGRDPETTPLSCPWGNGWGGAMGPSQFIPTTWQEYESKIAAALGVGLPDPWNPEHAFTATALYVRDLGAAAGGYTAEHTAALKYYAGSNWSNPANRFYGDSVMQHATTFQEQINFLDDVE